MESALYTKYLQAVNKRMNGIYQNCLDFVKSTERLYTEKKETQDAYKNNNGGFFASGYYYTTNDFHSYMLKNFLDPTTDVIGNKQFLRVFIEFLKNIKPVSDYEFIEEQLRVTCKENNVFIFDDKCGIIIENNIDKETAAKHAIYIDDREILAIVYIPLYSNWRAPDILLKAAGDKIITLPALDKGFDLRRFLEKCLELPENSEIQRYMIEQYAKLLIYIGGEKFMTKDIDIELLKTLYSDKQSIVMSENIANVWNQRYVLLAEVLKEPLRARLISELGFVPDPDDEYALYKDLDDNIAMVFYHSPEEPFIFGFCADGGFMDDDERDCLDELLQQDAFSTCFSDEFGEWGDEWVLKQFLADERRETPDDIVSFLVEKYRLLEREYWRLEQDYELDAEEEGREPESAAKS